MSETAGGPSLRATSDGDSRFRIIAGAALIVGAALFGGPHIGHMMSHGMWHIEFAVAILMVPAGVLVLCDRARVTSQLLCIIGLVIALSRLIFFLAHGMSRAVPYESILVAPLAIAVVYLMRPRRRVPGPSGPAPALASDLSNWHDFLLATLRDTGVERVEDRTIVQSLAMAGMLALGAVMVILTTFALPPLVRSFVHDLGSAGAAILVYAVVIPLWIVVIGGIGRFLALQFRRARMRSAEAEVLRDPKRRPILYLRNFALDAKALVPTLRQRIFTWINPFWVAWTPEERAVSMLRQCGPVIAIGRPGEKLPALGAARFYVAHDRWQRKVADVVKVSRLVLWTTGTTDGLRWEAQHLIEACAPDKLIVWPHPNQLRLSAAAREQEWSRFLDEMGALFPRPLPTRLADIGFIHFGADWTPIPITGHWDMMLLGKILIAKGLA